MPTMTDRDLRREVRLLRRQRAVLGVALIVLLAVTLLGPSRGDDAGGDSPCGASAGVVAPAPSDTVAATGITCPEASAAIVPPREPCGRTTAPTPTLLPRDPFQRTATPTRDLLRQLRVRKCRYIVQHLYPHSGFAPYVEFFVSEHERLGMAEAWWYSLVYGGANFSLRVGATAPGSCAGPMDVKHRPLILDPKANIRWHCREMAGFYRRGVRGLRLCECVFYPARPHDWGGGRFAKTDRRHRACIERAYQEGRL